MTWQPKIMPNSALGDCLVGTMLNGREAAPAPAAAPDFRALCAELVDALEGELDLFETRHNDLIERACAALEVKP